MMKAVVGWGWGWTTNNGERKRRGRRGRGEIGEQVAVWYGHILHTIRPACPALARLRVGGPSQVGTLYVRCTEDWRANRPAWVPSHRWALEMHLYTGTGADSPSQTVDVARRPEKGFFLAQEKGFPVGQLYHSNGYVCSRNTARDSLRIYLEWQITGRKQTNSLFRVNQWSTHLPALQTPPPHPRSVINSPNESCGGKSYRPHSTFAWKTGL